MEMGDVFRDLKLVYTDGVPYNELEHHLTEEDVQRWCVQFGLSRTHLFDAIARHLALGFDKRELTFEFCDAVVNDLSIAVTNTSGPRPELFWEVYSAFDEGEYYHDENRQEDPVEVHTRPIIAQLARTISSSPDQVADDTARTSTKHSLQ
ncbi:MAG TPA: hypothetical protein VG844_00070 [Terracidiphilus sp.]|nr:hypothetical protein [Terracidiphilus sp.]